jgi:molecular chaperone Hsp33
LIRCWCWLPTTGGGRPADPAHALKGEGNLAAGLTHRENEDQIGRNEDYNRIAHLASSLTREELLTLDVDTILRRLFWEEKLLRFEPQQGDTGPRFACTCSRERVGNMLRSLGRDEIESILAERDDDRGGLRILWAAIPL